MNGRVARLVAIGIATGVAGGLLGVGGGFVMVPAMVYLMKTPQREANGTSLAVIVPVAIVGAIILGRGHQVDPEIGMNVVELALIKQIILGDDSTEIKMILTTPFCPYAGSMIQQVKEQAESVVEHDVKVTLLAERWDPRDAGLMW